VAVSIVLLGTYLIYHQVNGYMDPYKYKYTDPELYNSLTKQNELEELYDYCYAHASDSANPIQDLKDKGLIDSEYTDCKAVKNAYDQTLDKTTKLLERCGIAFC
jgi:hypothetical protein